MRTPSALSHSAFIIGVIGGGVMLGVDHLLERLRIDDAVGAVPVHLMVDSDRYFAVTGHRADGSTFPMEMMITETRANEHTFYMGTFRAITERKHAQVELEKARDTAEVANRAKSQFLANTKPINRKRLTGILKKYQCHIPPTRCWWLRMRIPPGR